MEAHWIDSDGAERVCTRGEFEQALDDGALEVRVYPRRERRAEERWWKCRRNGATQTRKDGRWWTPVKTGFRDTFRIGNTGDWRAWQWRRACFRCMR